METGMIAGESNADYHGNGAVSTSSMKDFIESEYLFFRKHVARDVVRKETDAMRLGSAFHEFVLEPEEFKKNYAVLPPDINLRTKAGKEQRDELAEGGRQIITQAEADKMGLWRDSIHDNPLAKALFTNGVAELSWRTKWKNLTLQSRTDWFIESASAEQVALLTADGVDIKEGQPIIVDLKTTQELAPWFRDNYGNQILQFGYQLQYAFYLAVINKLRQKQGKEIVRHFYFVAVEKSAPNDCAVITIDERTFALAQTQLKHYLGKMSACFKSGKWRGYKDRGLMVSGISENICQRKEEEMFEKQDCSQAWLTGE